MSHDEIHQAIQNCEPITVKQALEILIHQARHSAPCDTDMDQGYTEEAAGTILEQHNEMLEALKEVIAWDNLPSKNQAAIVNQTAKMINAAKKIVTKVEGK